jgi:hypothetical protein
MVKVLIDYQSPIGHVSIINFYVKHFYSNFDEILINKDISKFVENNKKISFINIKKNFLLKIYNLKKIFEKYKNSKNVKIFMLSYEPDVIFFLGKITNLKNYEIFLLEHDNLNIKKKIRLFFLLLLSPKFNHLVYIKSAKKYLSGKLKKKKIFLTSHPLVHDTKYGRRIYNKKKIMKINNKKINILIPTRHHFVKELILKVANENSSCQFTVLMKRSNINKGLFLDINNISIQEKINDQELIKFDGIYLPLDDIVYKYRISAWLYKAILFNKVIIMEPNNLYKFEHVRFPNHIVKYNGKIKIKKKKIGYFIEKKKYNYRLIHNLKKIMNL